ncbi:putative homoaconitase precursor [Fusarium bulbicola]|nr:putative homoaconitase precursor [Fusarium bulbicola]
MKKGHWRDLEEKKESSYRTVYEASSMLLRVGGGAAAAVLVAVHKFHPVFFAHEVGGLIVPEQPDQQLYLNLGTLSLYVSESNCVKVATTLHELTPKYSKINKAYRCTNSRNSDIQAAAITMVKLQPQCYGTLASIWSEDEALECASCHDFWATKIGRPVARPRSTLEVTCRALYKVRSLTLFDHSGSEQPRSVESDLNVMAQQLDPFFDPPRIPRVFRGEIVLMDMDNQDTDQIYPGSMTYESNVSKEATAKACMRNYDPGFQEVIRPNDILVSGNGFGCGSSHDQAATVILANSIHLVVAGSFSNIFSRNSINNGLMGLELPCLVRRLRAAFPKDAKNPIPTFRTGWTLG